MIHSSAIVHPNANINKAADIGPYCIVGEHVTVGARATLLGHVVVTGRTTIGDDTMVHPFATIGAPSQDRKAEEGEIAFTTIGARTVIREYVSIHRGTADAGGVTSVGDDCLILAYGHVAHNCRIGNDVTMSNLAQLAGHVVVDDHATIGAMAGVHQFVRIGTYAFVGGYAKVPRDLPPYFLADGTPPEVLGPNLIGLRRAGFPRETINELKGAYTTLYRSDNTMSRAIASLRETVGTDAGRTLLAFLEAESARGILEVGARPVRVFFSTGEPSGEILAADLLGAMRIRMPIVADGLGDERLRNAGVRIVQRTRGWSTLGIFEALRMLPRVAPAGVRLALALRRDPPDLLVLVDFGAFNVRLAHLLRRLGYRGPVVYYAPPSAWLDSAKRARAVARVADALTLFAHQARFYRSLRLPVGYVGHPLVSTIAPRATRPPPPGDGGVVALLPGSRAGEIARHTPRLLDAFERVRRVRPNARAVLVAASDDAQRYAEHALTLRSPLALEIVRDARGALRDADAAAIASGTAVLEAALLETPAVALYVLTEAQMRIARRIYRRAYITLPNLVLDEPLVPELVQDAASPEALAAAVLALLACPDGQREGYARLRAALGPPDALQRNADWVLSAAEESVVARAVGGAGAPGVGRAEPGTERR